jgi:hypothetical protein
MLSAILWILWTEASRAPEYANALRSKAYFEAGGKRLGVDTEVGEIPEWKGSRSVTLIVPA